MRSPGINGEGELRGHPANPGSPGKMAVKTECVYVCYNVIIKVFTYHFVQPQPNTNLAVLTCHEAEHHKGSVQTELEIAWHWFLATNIQRV